MMMYNQGLLCAAPLALEPIPLHNRADEYRIESLSRPFPPAGDTPFPVSVIRASGFKVRLTFDPLRSTPYRNSALAKTRCHSARGNTQQLTNVCRGLPLIDVQLSHKNRIPNFRTRAIRLDSLSRRTLRPFPRSRKTRYVHPFECILRSSFTHAYHSSRISDAFGHKVGFPDLIPEIGRNRLRHNPTLANNKGEKKI